MITMIEKIATALYEHQLKEYPELATAKREFYEAGIYHNAARAALAAMGEPTDAMIADAHWSALDGEWELEEAHKEHWQSMIVAALAESQR